MVKSLPAKVRDIRDVGLMVGKIPWRRTRWCTSVFMLEKPTERGAWWATVHGVAKSQTQLRA